MRAMLRFADATNWWIGSVTYLTRSSPCHLLTSSASSAAAPELICSIKSSSFGSDVPNLSNQAFPTLQVAWLGDVLIGSHLDGSSDLGRVVRATQNDHGYGGKHRGRLAPGQEIKTAYLRHFQVQHHDVRQGMRGTVGINSFGFQVVDGLLARSQSLQPDIEVRFIDGDPEERKIGVVVIDEQNV